MSVPYLTQVSKAVVTKGGREMEGKHIGFFTEFITQAGEEVTMKVGISFVDMDGAERNYRSEIAQKDFNQVRKEAVASWDRQLSRMEVKGGSEDEKTIFYTSLYHTMIDPRIIADVDGRYTGGDGKIHRSKSFAKRTIFSGWDVFRSQFPLQTIINPRMVNDEINSLVSLAEESGHEYYDRWEFLNAYSGCMIGNPAISVLTDAYLKGICQYDVEKAYRYACNTAERFGNGERGYSVMSVSKTLEYAYFDWCLSQLAKALGYEADAAFYENGGRIIAIRSIRKWDGFTRVRKTVHTPLGVTMRAQPTVSAAKSLTCISRAGLFRMTLMAWCSSWAARRRHWQS